MLPLIYGYLTLWAEARADDAVASGRRPERRHGTLTWGVSMTDDMMSQLTADLMLLLYEDGVDREELTALVGSAFRDGVEYTIKNIDEMRTGRET